MADTIRIEERTGLSMASILSRQGVDAARIGKALAIALPGGPAFVADDERVVIGTGPGTWLAIRQGKPSGWCATLEQQLTGLASVSDQTGALRVFHLEGPHARTVLQRGMSIDLDISAFPAGSAAVSAIGHIDVIVRCLDGQGRYEAAIHRSYAHSFLRWLETASGAL